MGLFRFARATRLQETFQPAAQGQYLTLSEVESRVQLVHPAVGPAENASKFRSFVFPGTLGAVTLALSPTPANLVQYYISVDLQHNDPVAGGLRLEWILNEFNTGFNVSLRDSLTESTPGGAGLIPQNAFFSIRTVVVPPGYNLIGVAPGIAAGAAINIRGCVVILPLAEPPPPLFR